MIRVGIEEVQGTIGALLEQAEHGEEIVITRDGTAIAKIIASGPELLESSEEKRAAASAAIDRIRERAKTLPKWPFDWEEIKADRDFGRR